MIFKISLHKKDFEMLSRIKNYFGVGIIKKHGETTLQYSVTSSKDLNIIISHFDKYPLISEKRADYELFKQALNLFKNKEHLSVSGFKKILMIRTSMNLGLPEELKIAFPTIVPVLRPVVLDKDIKDPNWVAGFVSGEGSFIIGIFNRGPNTKPGIQLLFKITQHSRDANLLKILVNYLNCGRYTASLDYNRGEFIVSNLPDMIGKIIPWAFGPSILFREWNH